uniref:Cysteine-rich n=2 Tax=Brassica campestris TaxID=3711 RepID=M4DS24_BRACM
MCRISLFPILLSVLVTFSFISVSGQICGNTGGTFRPNTTYDSNRRLILSSLASNVTGRDGFFYNSSFGQEQDRVYAMGLCVPGAKPKDCSDCITDAVTKMIQNCTNQTEAFSWPGTETLCMVRYANSSFFGTMDLEPNSLRYNTGNITISMSELERIWDAFMTRMIDSASSGRSGASSSSSGKYYAADVTSLTTFQRVYALMECTPDLSPGNCEACLRENVRRYQQCCRGNQGGVARRPSCFFRWDLYPFLGAFDNISSGAPPSQPFTGDGDGASKKDGDSLSVGAIVGIVAAIIVIVLVLLALAFVFYRRRKSHQEDDFQSGDDISTTHSLQFDFKTVEAATDNFSRSNRLGQGGFGEVYKGILPNGTEVAVKRLSKTSGQCALLEFKNEVLVVAKLQHRNLVKVLGCCSEPEEKIIVYEFVPNNSLDYLLFDPTKQGQLDWTMRYKIISGIARGILYLHQDSRLIIIHRDLKASNILLDADMNPKITGFGMARITMVGQALENTSRIVGTYGYMAPEYAMHGQFSTKSDVYSFGVLVLEIVIGKRNSSFHETDSNDSNLVTSAWKLWRNGSPLELVDPTVRKTCDSSEVTRCIHIALLCVQENPMDRPTLSTIILMLTSNTVTLPVPHQPGFFFKSTRDQDLSAEDLESGQSTGKFVPFSINDETINPTKKRQLHWKKRYNIIGGITREIIYLHQDSRLTIIRRDLKASNILLDAEMIPKIADFGMARIFGMDQSGANTSRIVGTHGYMPPEYLIHGQFSMKSDVHSFGVLVLEIISGRKNSSFHQTSDATAENFVTQAWKLWKNRSPLELVDPNIVENYQMEEVTRCIHIALLCVQEDPTDRPNLSTITLMLTSNTLILPVPQPPGFFLQNRRNQKQGLEELESSQSTI